MATAQCSFETTVFEHFEKERSIVIHMCKHWLEKKEEKALFKNRISAATERRRGKEAARKRPDLVERGKSVRTSCHVRHFPDLPRGEITIEGISIVKHCTTATKKSPRIKMGWKKKRGESIVQK